jgi:hypothetical protein
VRKVIDHPRQVGEAGMVFPAFAEVFVMFDR